MILNLLLSATTASAAAAAETLHIEGLISDLAFILILAAVTTVVFKWLKQPVVLGYIVAGFLASPQFEYLPSVTTATNIEFWAQLGIVILLFSLGLEFSFKKLMNAGGSAIVTALIIIVGMVFTGWWIGNAMGFSNINAIFLGAMLSMSSTTIIIKALTDLGLRHRKFATQVLAVLVVEDLFAVLMMVVLSSIALNKTVESSELLYSVAKLTFFLIIWFLVGVYVLPSLLNAIRRYLSNETLLIIAMGMCLGMAVFSVTCGFSLALGAFVMGSILAGTSFAERIDHVVAPVKDLFGAVFFISVGMMVNPHVIVEYWSPIVILSAVVVIGMIFFGTTGMLVTGQSLLVALESGFSLTQIGEFSFIIATLGMSLGVLDASIYPIVVAVSVITTFLTPYFIKLAPLAHRALDRVLPERIKVALDRYAARSAERSAASSEIWVVLLKRYAWRLVIYSVVLIAITLLSLNLLLPLMVSAFPSWGRLACCIVTVAVMSPFLMALASPSISHAERQALLKKSSRYDTPLVVMFLFRLLLAWLFLFYLLAMVYSFGVAWVVGIVVFILLFAVLSKRLKHRLRDIETKFINNLNERELRRSGKNNNLINDMHLAYVEVGYGCPFVGERLQDSELRKHYGVNVVNIQRDSIFIPVPRGDVRLFPGDVIGIVGTESCIQQALPVIEAESKIESNQPHASAGDVKLTNVVLASSSPVAGKSIASSGIRERFQSLLVSVQRDGEFLPIRGDLHLQPGDILGLVGDKEQLARIRGN